jgi:hypothetical protein
MPYLMMDDNFADHPKIDGLSDGAFRLHVAAMCYAAKHLTDGAIPAVRVPRLTPRYRPALLKELLKIGLWVEHDQDYRIHDFLQWNKSRQWWERERAAGAERQRKSRERREQERLAAEQREAEERERTIVELGIDPDTGQPL